MYIHLSQTKEGKIKKERKKEIFLCFKKLIPCSLTSLLLKLQYTYRSLTSYSNLQVFDSPHLKVLVGKGVRKRLDAKAIVQLLQSFEAPIGT